MNRPNYLNTKVLRAITTLLMAVLIAIGVQACSSVPLRLTPPSPNLLSLSVLESSSEGQLFAMVLQLVNPNEAEIPVVRLDFDIRLGGEGRLIGEHTTAFTLPARGSEIVDIEVFSEFVSSPSRLMAFAEGPNNSLIYEFHGDLVLDASMRDPLEVFRRGQVPLTVQAEAQ